MSSEHPIDPGSGSLSLARQVDEVCLRFEAAWQAGQRPGIEEYLAGAQEPLRSALLRELVALEIEYRRRGGESPAPAGYEVLGELGRGSMGVVFKARQSKLNRLVALKMILAGAYAGPELLARFKSEGEAVARMQHPNVVQIYDVDEHDGLPFFALEFVEGGSLERKLAGTPQPARSAAELLETLARAMHYAHERGIVHRDLKPANVLLTADGTPKITDFGVAKILVWGATGETQTGAIVGTPSYMAPEQAAGLTRQVGAAADIYALGAILYELLTGRPPFRATTVLETLEQVRTQEAVPPGRLQPKVPRDLETICLKCLHKEPARRYASALDLADDLRRFLDGKPVRARPVGAWERGLKWARRRPAWAALVAVSGLAALALVGVAVTLAVSGVQVRRAKDRAEAGDRLARQAVEDYFTAVSEDEDLKAQGLEPLRRKLLESARQYYEKFVAERGDDPNLRADLALAYSRLGAITLAIDSKVKAIGYFQQADDVFERLALSQPAEPKYQRELARNYYNLGYLYRETGDTARAETFLRKAVDLQQPLVDRDRDPARADYRRDLGLSFNELGNVYRTLAQMPRAEESYRHAADIHGGLRRDFADVALYQRDLAACLQNLGELYRITDRPAEAQEMGQQALAIQQQLVEQHPFNTRYQRDLALSYMNLGILAYFAHQADTAEKAYRQATDILERLTSLHPAVTEWQADLTLVYNNLGLLYTDTNTLDKAKAFHEKAIAIREHLVAGDRDSPELQRLLATSYQNLGNVYYQGGQSAEAEKQYREALARFETLAGSHKDVVQYQIDLGGTTGNLGRVAADRGRHEEALDWYNQSIATLEAVLRTQRDNPDARKFLSNARCGRASTLDQLGRPGEAVKEWDRALELDKGPNRIPLRCARAISLARSGDHQQAVAEAKQLARESNTAAGAFYDLACVYSQASSAAGRDAKLSRQEQDRQADQYAARAVELLATARDAEYFKDAARVEHLKKDSDLAPLRSRADFRKLARELEEKAKPGGANEPTPPLRRTDR